MNANQEHKLFPNRTECKYASCYCEENVWHLCDWIRQHDASRLDSFHVVFISNETRSVPLWMQTRGTSLHEPVVWDYHVILIGTFGSRSWVYDLDTRLDFPVLFSTYLAKAMRSDRGLLPQFFRKFRVIRTDDFLRTFASDRSHMIDPTSAEWLAPPPVWSLIQTPEHTNNIQDFIGMAAGQGHGQVMNLDQFKAKFSLQ